MPGQELNTVESVEAQQVDNALPQGNEVVPPIEAPVLDENALLEAARTGNEEVLEQARQQLFEEAPVVPDVAPQVEPQVVAPQEQAIPVTPQPVVPVETPQDPDSLSIQFHGQDRVFQDPDGFLGRKDLDGLKTSQAHLRAKLEFEERKAGEARNYAATVERKNQELQRRFDEISALKAATPTIPRQAAPAAPQVSLPDVPAPPVLPESIYDWDDTHHAAKKVYDTNLNKYNTDTRAYMEYLTTLNGQTQAAPALPQEYIIELEELKALKNEIVQGKQIEQEKSQQRAFWDSLRSFQNKHAQFGTSTDIEQTHTSIQKWYNDLAIANGYVLPIGATQVQSSEYERGKAAVVNAYISGDQAVITRSQGYEPPEGYENYVKLHELTKRRDDLVGQGIFGQQVPLETVYLHELNSSGELNQVMNSMLNEEHAKTTQSFGNAIAQSQQSATSIPPEYSQGRSMGVTSPQQADEELQFMKDVQSSPARLQDPATKARFEEIGKRHGLM